MELALYLGGIAVVIWLASCVLGWLHRLMRRDL
jgi:hypothetical protein